MASSSTVPFLLPGGKETYKSFQIMNREYLNQHFPHWEKESNFLPSLPISKYPEPPPEASGGERAPSESETDSKYENLLEARDGYETELRVYRMLEKFAAETKRVLFTVHGIDFNEAKWKSLIQLMQQEGNADITTIKTALSNIVGIKKEKKKGLKDMEIDYLVVDKLQGLMTFEVKSTSKLKDTTSAQAAYNRASAAMEQLDKNEALITFLLKYLKHGWKQETAVTKIICLPNDTQESFHAANAHAKCPLSQQTLQRFKFLFSDSLKNLDAFKRWWITIENSCSEPNNNENFFEEITPFIAGLRALRVFHSSTDAKHDYEQHTYKSTLSATDRNISEESISARSRTQKSHEPLTNIWSSPKDSVYQTSSNIKLLYLTPRQQTLLEQNCLIIQGPAGVGKTVVTMFKILDIAKTDFQSPILILCKGSYIWEYRKILESNELEVNVVEKCENLTVLEAITDPDTRKINVICCSSKDAHGIWLCDISTFVDAANSVFGRRRQLMKLQSKKQNITWQEPKLSWTLNCHLFCDDCDLYADFTAVGAELMRQSSASSSKNLCFWIALDHHQAAEVPWLYNHQHDTERITLRELRQIALLPIESMKDVLRNSTEIVMFTRMLASRLQSQSIESGYPLPALGHNIHGGAIRVFQLVDQAIKKFEAAIQSKAKFETELYSICTDLFARFCLFIMAEHLKDQEFATFVVTLDETFVTTLLQMKKHKNLQFKTIKESVQETDDESSFLVDYPMEARSFEWKAVVVIVPLWFDYVKEGGRRSSAEMRHAYSNNRYVELYQACTRARTQLYIICSGNGDVTLIKQLLASEDTFILIPFQQQDDTFATVVAEELVTGEQNSGSTNSV